MKYLMAIVLAALLAACGQVVEINGRKLDPQSSAHDHVAIAVQYLQKGDYDEAHRHLQKALDLDPKSAEAHNFLAYLLEQEGDQKEAEKHYRRAVSLQADYSQAHNNYGSFLYKKGDFSGAASEFAKASEDLSYDKRELALENLGRALVKTGDTAGAETALTRALRLNQDLPLANFEMAQIQFNKGNTAGARQLYQRYLQLTPGQVQSARTLWLGIRLERINGDKNALASYELALKRLYPDSEEYTAYQKSLGQGK